MTSYRIGELATALGTRVETLRFYEREGLLEATGRSDNRYRYYSEAARQQLAFILQAKALGFSLADIRELLAIRVEPGSHSCGEVKSLTEQKLAIVDRKIAELQGIREALAKVAGACHGGEVPASHCSILHALEADAL